jgi:hypothetical protein
MNKICDETKASKAIVSSSTPTLHERERERQGGSLVRLPVAADVRTTRPVNEFDSTTGDVTPLSTDKLHENRQSPRTPIVPLTNEDDTVTNSNAIAIQNKSLEDSTKSAFEPFNERDEIALYISHFEQFRRCSLLVKEENKKLLKMVSRLCNERDALSIELGRVRTFLVSKNITGGDVENKETENSEQSKFPSTADCEQLEERTPLEAKLDQGRQSRIGVLINDAKSEMMNRILYLEKWKANAMTTIESQLKSLDTTVNKSCYLEALNELDNLKLDNILLIDRVSVDEVSLLRYRKLVKSLSCSIDDNEKVDTLEKQAANSLPSSATPDDRIKALSVSF